ncbi:MAG: type II toxin-antitoxin system RelB/DinJ family antitoxin [Candidatus Colwellbacteria bacterium]
MAKTVINIKTDREVKEEAQRIAKELGIPLSTVVNSYLKDFIRDREFTVSLEPQLKPRVWDEMKRAVDDAKKGKSVSPAFSEVDDAIAWLHGK